MIGYHVIQDEKDEYGYGDYLSEVVFATYDEAVKYLKAHSHCTHVDMWDGEEWHYHVTHELKRKLQ